MSKTIIYKQESNIGIIVLNRPEVMNAINMELAGDLLETLDQAESDPSVRVLIITGGDRFFCSGADIKSMLGEVPSDFIRNIRRPIYAMEKLPKPVIAAINGVAAGGGFELALACDFRVAAINARIGLPEINIGTIPGAGGTQKLARLIGLARAKELLFLGKLIDGSVACSMGLAHIALPPEEVMSRALSLASELAAKPPLALASLKHLVDASVNVDVESGMDDEAQCVSFLNRSEDFREGRKAFVEKRSPKFTGK